MSAFGGFSLTFSLRSVKNCLLKNPLSCTEFSGIVRAGISSCTSFLNSCLNVAPKVGVHHFADIKFFWFFDTLSSGTSGVLGGTVQTPICRLFIFSLIRESRAVKKSKMT